MGISLDELLNEEATSPPPEPKKKKTPLSGWNRIGCMLLAQTFVIVVLGYLLLDTFWNTDRELVVRVESTLVPAGTIQPTPTPQRIFPILAVVPEPFSPQNANRMRELVRFDYATYMAWSSDGQTIVMSIGPQFYWYNLYQQRPLVDEQHLRVGQTWPYALSPNRLHLATTDSTNGQLVLRLVELQEIDAVIGAFAGQVRSLNYSDNGQMLAIGTAEGGVRVWNNLSSSVHWDALPADPSALQPVEGVDFSPDNQWLAAAGHNQSVTIWNVETGEQLASIPTEKLPQDVMFSPDGRHLAYSVAESAFLWNMETQQQVHVLARHEGWVYHLGFSTDGRLLVTGGGDGNIILWDTQPGAMLRVLNRDDLPSYVKHMSVSPDGRLIAAAYSEEGYYPLVLWGVGDE